MYHVFTGTTGLCARFCRRIYISVVVPLVILYVSSVECCLFSSVVC